MAATMHLPVRPERTAARPSRPASPSAAAPRGALLGHVLLWTGPVAAFVGAVLSTPAS